MATTAIDSLRGILNGFRALNSKGIYSMNATETDLLRQILTEVQALSLGVTIADGSITTAKYADESITEAKLADGSVTTIKIPDTAVTPAKLLQPFTFGVPVAASGVAAIDFGGIPSWANLIIASFYQISLNGTAAIRIQLGTSGGIVSTGYVASSLNAGNGVSPTAGNHTNGLVLNTATAANLHSGNIFFTRNTGNTWVASLNAGLSNNPNSLLSAGGIALADALTQIRFVSGNGTDLFDGGTISLMFL